MKDVNFEMKVLTDDVVVGYSRDKSFDDRVAGMKERVTKQNPDARIDFIDVISVVPILTKTNAKQNTVINIAPLVGKIEVKNDTGCSKGMKTTIELIIETVSYPDETKGGSMFSRIDAFKRQVLVDGEEIHSSITEELVYRNEVSLLRAFEKWALGKKDCSNNIDSSALKQLLEFLELYAN